MKEFFFGSLVTLVIIIGIMSLFAFLLHSTGCHLGEGKLTTAGYGYNIECDK